MDINIFTRIGFVVLVGLASKNAILIVEFAKHQRISGKSRRDATLEACKLRLRPIVMTSLAFILGVVPLIVSRGAGAEMRQTLGTAVFSGMLGVTLFGLLLTPVFFFSIDWLGERHLFASPFMQHVNRASLAVLTLAPIRWTARAAWHRATGRRKRPFPVPAHKRPVETVDLDSAPVNGKTPYLQPHVMRKQLEAADAPAVGLSREELTNEE